jgi:hypothetical protein
MNQYDGKTFLFGSGALILLLVLVLMTSCAPATTAKKNVRVNDDRVNPIANVKAIGKTLGCMFGGCKSEEQIQKEQDEITKEFDRVDAQKKADQDKTQPASK